MAFQAWGAAVVTPIRRGADLVRRRPRATTYALAFLVHLLVAPFLIHDWDGYVFITTAEDFLRGQSPYETVERESSYIYIGDGVPVVNSWYAYPPVSLLLFAPFYGVFTFLLGHAPWVERLGVKIPIVLGDLALAYAAYLLVRASVDDPERAERRARLAERAILFNPFLVFISAAWGMFDAWMMALLVGAIWALAVRRFALGGALLALAVLVKPFPALALPLIAFYAWRQGAARGLARWAAGGAATAAVVCLPFLLLSPGGFMQQVVFNHMGRPPQGFTLMGVPLAFGWINGILGTSLPTGATPEDISRWSFLLLVLVLAAVWAQAGSIRRSADVVHLSLAALVGALLVSKVVNEQYFVMPVALATVAFALSERPVHLWLRRLYTFGGFLSGVLLGYHFFTFLPVDVAEAIFPWDPLSTVPRLTRALGWTDEQAFVYPTLLAAASLVPAMLLSVAFVGRQLAAPLRDMPAMLRERRMPVAAVAVLLTFLVVAPASAAILATRASPDPTDGFEPPEGPLVGAYYYMWWNNPAHDPGIEYGNWRNGVSQVPEDGYYTTTAGKMRNDFRAMRAAGVDIVVYVYHGYDKPKLPALVRLAAETGVTTAPLLDLHDLVDRPDARPRDANGTAAPVHWGLSMRNETRDAIVERILDPLADFSHFPTWWRIDDKPVVFLRPADRVFYDADGPTREALVDAAWRIAREDERLGLAGPAPAREALAAQAPGSPEDLRLPGNSLWRRAYHETVRAFWQGVSDGVAERLGPIHLVGSATWDPTLSSNRGAALSLATQGATNASFAFSLSDVWQNHFGDGYGAHLDRWRDALATRAQAARSAGETLFATVTPGYDDRPLRKGEGFVVPYEDNGTRTYERQWDDAAAARPDVILVDSWNDFHSGTAVEPTLDRGDALLRLTAERAAAWKAGPAREAPSVLLVTDHLGAAYHNDSGDPDGAYAFSVRLARAAERWAPGRVAAVDWNGPALATTDLSAYDLVVVEPGAKWPRTADALALVDRLRNHSLSGGAVLLLGSDVGVHYARLANWTEPPLPTARLRLDHEPAYEIPVDPWTARHDLPPGARVLLWMTDGRDRYPALWEIPLGDGTLAVTAFRPQGASDADPIDPAVFPLVLARARSHEVAP